MHARANLAGPRGKIGLAPEALKLFAVHAMLLLLLLHNIIINGTH